MIGMVVMIRDDGKCDDRRNYDYHCNETIFGSDSDNDGREIIIERFQMGINSSFLLCYGKVFI